MTSLKHYHKCNMCLKRYPTVITDLTAEIKTSLCHICFWEFEQVKEFQNGIISDNNNSDPTIGWGVSS